MKHTDECKRLQMEFLKVMREWKREFPNHCAKCNGHGFVYKDYDPSSNGVALSLGRKVEIHSCNCWKNKQCPRCLIKLSNEWCLSCGWEYDETGSYGLPAEPDCLCLADV